MYNNSNYCNINNAIVDSLYSQKREEISSHPPGSYLLLDNTGVALLDNTDEELITP